MANALSGFVLGRRCDVCCHGRRQCLHNVARTGPAPVHVEQDVDLEGMNQPLWRSWSAFVSDRDVTLFAMQIQTDFL